MDSFKGPCPHHSIPVEMDERMSPSFLDSAWFRSCDECNRTTGSSTPEQDPPARAATSQNPVPERRYQDQTTAANHNPPGATAARPARLRDQAPLYEGPAGAPNWHRVPSLDGSLESPLPLVSEGHNHNQHAAALHPAARPHGPVPLQRCHARQCACCPPVNSLHHGHHYPEDPYRPVGRAAPPRDVMLQVSVNRSLPAGREAVKKTISLPEESRHVFITYSVDTAKDIPAFVQFLINQGFKPAIDMFDYTLRRMDINKWMDSYLNDKSVLIIVVISPGYKEDVEGEGDDEHGMHGLHTKYIHNQIQNEFIQQGCKNFRLVPVLFPNATKKHVPNWLQNTDIFRWPQDSEDIVLRLLREERYILPPCAAGLTLTVRPL